MDIIYGVLGSHFIDLVTHIKHLVCPAVVIAVLIDSDLTCTLVLVCSKNAVHEESNALGVLCALAEHISLKTCGEIILVCIGILGHGNEHNVIGIAVGCCPDIGSAFKSIKTADVEQLLALAYVLNVCLPVEQILVKNKTVLVQIIHKVHCSFKVWIVEIVNKLSVPQLNGGNAACQHERLFIEPAVKTVAACVNINIIKKHLLECIPVPVALFKQLCGICEAVFLDSLLVVDNYRTCGSLCCHDIVIAVKEEVIVQRLYIAPKLIIIVDIIVNGLEHSVCNALGECIKVAARNEVNALAAEDLCGKICEAVVPCCGNIFDLAVVLALEKLQRKSLCVAGSSCMERIVEREPLDSLIFKLNIGKKRRNIIYSILIFLAERLCIYFNGSRCGCGRFNESFVLCFGTAAAGCKSREH